MVNHKTRFTDWNRRPDIKSKLKMELILLLDKHGYPPDIDRDEVYRDVFEQAENLKKYNP